MIKSENVIDWLSRWCVAQCQKGCWGEEILIAFQTLGNPGWAIEVDVSGTELKNLKIVVGTIEKSENDWFNFRFKDEKFQAAGDAGKLLFLLIVFRSIFEGGGLYKLEEGLTKKSNILIWLSAWYASQCDGDWEDMYGVSVKYSKQLLGWEVVIELIYTELENLHITNSSFGS